MLHEWLIFMGSKVVDTYTSRPIFIRHGQVLDLGSPSCFSTEKLEVKHCPNMVVLWGKKTLM